MTARKLWDAFGSVEAIAAATPEAIAAIDGIGPRQAAKLADILRALARPED